MTLLVKSHVKMLLIIDGGTIWSNFWLRVFFIKKYKISFAHDRCYAFPLFGVLGGNQNSFRRTLVRSHFLRIIKLGGTHETLCGTS